MQVEIDLLEAQTVFKNLEDLDESDIIEIGTRTVENSTKESFKTETDPWGDPWVNQDSPTYNNLDKTHTMKGSLHSKVNDNVGYVGINAVSKKGYLYPAVHQFGSKKEKGRGSNIPSRKFFPIDEDNNLAPDVEDEIMENISDYIDEILE